MKIMNEKQVALRVRREYFDAIKSHEKNVEYRKFSPFWQQRLANATIAVFFCGKDVHRRRIIRVEHIPTPLNFSEQGRKDVPTASCFAIFLGESLDRTRQEKNESESNAS